MLNARLHGWQQAFRLSQFRKTRPRTNPIMKLISLFLVIAVVALPTACASNSTTTSTNAANSTTETSSTNETGLLNPILGHCDLKAENANSCIEAFVTDTEECATCIGDFLDNTIMTAFPATTDSSSNSSSSSSAKSTCDDLSGQACSTLTGTCAVCKACKAEINVYLGCGIGATAEAAGLSCVTGSSRNLNNVCSGVSSSGSGPSGSGNGSSGARVSHSVLVATMVAIATGFVIASV